MKEMIYPFCHYSGGVVRIHQSGSAPARGKKRIYLAVKDGFTNSNRFGNILEVSERKHFCHWWTSVVD